MAAIVTSVQSPAQLANVAFVRLGFKLRAGNLLDGSDHSRHALDVFGQARDKLLREADYPFSERTASLSLLKSAPQGGYFPPNNWNPSLNPPLGFTYEYAYPTDAIKIRHVKPMPLYVVSYDPQPHDFTDYNDNYLSPPQRTIVSNVPYAIATYTGRVTNPAQWDVAFTEALATELMKQLGPILAGPDIEKVAMPEAQAAMAASDMADR